MRKRRKFTRGLFGEERSNGSVVHRKGGKFAPKPSLTGLITICPECNRINPHKVEPKRVSGFIDPVSMTPQKPSNCHNCGADLTEA